jgi:hypothetical protein
LGNAGRNTLVGPGNATLDGSIYKNAHLDRINERLNVQFRAELFNVLNHANFAPPLDNNFVFNQDTSPIDNAGELTSTQGSSRQIQFGLKLCF